MPCNHLYLTQVVTLFFSSFYSEVASVDVTPDPPIFSVVTTFKELRNA
jgi:hypothetical protein